MICLNRKEEKTVKCCKCGKKIPVSEAVKIDKDYYCKDCAEDEKDWRFLELMESIK